jgi:hypothetical protein
MLFVGPEMIIEMLKLSTTWCWILGIPITRTKIKIGIFINDDDVLRLTRLINTVTGTIRGH